MNAEAKVRNELGFYALAGAPNSPRDIVDEVRDAEAMGLGTAFISERFDIKEAATLSGAAAAVSERIRIATAATNQTTRHPNHRSPLASLSYSVICSTGCWMTTIRGATGGCRESELTRRTGRDFMRHGRIKAPWSVGRASGILKSLGAV